VSRNDPFPPNQIATQGARIDGSALDVSQTPSYAFGARGLMWWGTMGLIAIEGTVFALTIMAYFYLRTNADEWPLGVPPPQLLWGTLNIAVILLSIVPNHWTKGVAEKHDLGRTRSGLLLCLVFELLAVALRFFEFTVLNCAWDTNAYGSIVWLLLGLHTLHLVTDFADTAVLYALVLKDPVEGKAFVDVTENAFYWDFVVLAWIPIYVVIYWGARF
jgi:cytochrome c oxidase subunit 3